MIEQIFSIIILIMSVVIHEFAHGYTAYRLGDNTAQIAGRLTLNPLKHLDIFGSILLPGFFVLMNTGFVIGWAKPVPYNPRNLRNGNRGDFWVSISGILANLFIAIIFGLLIRFGNQIGLPVQNFSDPQSIYFIFSTIVIINLVLAFFNLIPIPPLDGSKVLFSVIHSPGLQEFLERWGLFLLIFFIFFIWQYLFPFIYLIYSLITGL